MIPGAFISMRDSQDSKQALTFGLPLTQVPKYASLFKELESLQGVTFTIVLTSLEDAFLNFSKTNEEPVD